MTNPERAKTASHVAEVATMLHKLGHFSQAHEVANQAYRLIVVGEPAKPEAAPPIPRHATPQVEYEQWEHKAELVGDGPPLFVWGAALPQRTRFHIAATDGKRPGMIHALCSAYIDRFRGSEPPAELTLCPSCKRKALESGEDALRQLVAAYGEAQR